MLQLSGAYLNKTNKLRKGEEGMGGTGSGQIGWIGSNSVGQSSGASRSGLVAGESVDLE